MTTTLQGPEYDYIRRFVRERSAIVLDDGKEYLIDSRLLPVARQHGLTSLGQLVTRLRTDGSLHRQVVEAMTTNETSFFRDIHPFEALRDTVLPRLIEKRRATKTLSIWCAASSSGQEPYTIAMVVRDNFPELRGWNVRIFCTDLSTEMVQRTREGKFSQLEVNRGLPARQLTRWFQRQGTTWQVVDDLRQMLDVRQMNLAEPWPFLPSFDVVFLRNVMIYFDQETKRSILGRLRRQLRDDGRLFLGAAETTLMLDDGYEREVVGQAVCYRLRGGG